MGAADSSSAAASDRWSASYRTQRLADAVPEGRETAKPGVQAGSPARPSWSSTSAPGRGKDLVDALRRGPHPNRSSAKRRVVDDRVAWLISVAFDRHGAVRFIPISGRINPRFPPRSIRQDTPRDATRRDFVRGVTLVTTAYGLGCGGGSPASPLSPPARSHGRSRWPSWRRADGGRVEGDTVLA